jgi:ABC-type transport system involved in multi-copper enzyme maturation permease subunit
MSTVGTIVRKEVRDAAASRWLLLYAGLFAVLSSGMAYLGYRNLGSVGFDNFSRTTAGLLNLCLLLAPLLALVIAAGSIAGERERGNLTYLLSQPLHRWELLLGKFAGLSLAIGLATIAGFGIGGLFIALFASTMQAGTYLLLLVLVLALVAVMTGIGLAASVVSTTRIQAAGLAIVIWFTAVLFFDLVLIGMVSSTSLGGFGLLAALLLNPVEIVRVLAIIHLEPDLQVLGPFGSFLMEEVGKAGASAILALALAVWVIVPLTAAAWLFERRET